MAIPSLAASKCLGKPVSIYVLVDPRDHSAFYVGATTKALGLRFSSHLNDARHLQMVGKRYDAIRRILDAGKRPEIHQVEIVAQDVWVEAEQFWIGYFRSLGAELTNRSIGGPGALGIRQSANSIKSRMAARSASGPHPTRSASATEKGAAKLRHVIEVNGQTFVGIKRASVALGIAYVTLQHWLDTGRARRLTGPKVGFLIKRKGLRSGVRHHASRPVDVAGVRYCSVTEAARAESVTISTMMRWLRHGRGRASYRPPMADMIAFNM